MSLLSLPRPWPDHCRNGAIRRKAGVERERRKVERATIEWTREGQRGKSRGRLGEGTETLDIARASKKQVSRKR
jgi:hypothetical protein